METLLVQPKNAEELALLQSMLKKMSICNTVISIEDKEDFGLLMLMQKSDRNKRVSRDTIMKSPRAAAHPSTNDHWGFHMAKLKYHRRWLNKK